MAFAKILLSGDAAELDYTAAANIGTAATSGLGAAASRNDHVHIIPQSLITTGLIADRTLLATDLATMVITSNELNTDSVTFVQLSETGTYTMTVLGLQPQATFSPATEGTIIYDSTDDHLYINQG